MVKAPDPLMVKEFSCRLLPREMQLLAMSALVSMTGGNSVKLFWIELVSGALMLITPAIPILRHPLWQDNHPEWIASEAMPSLREASPTASFANAKAQTLYHDYEVKPVNPFLILRRPGDYA